MSKETNVSVTLEGISAISETDALESVKITSEAEAPVVLERRQRLSQSQLWKAQRTFYKQQGISAWSQHTVPHYITSNPFIADAYSKVVLGFLRDWYSHVESPLDMSQPVYIIELGTGHGRFSYHFLKKFLDSFTRSSLKKIPITYVMTDLSENLVTFWQEHPSLQPFVEQGLLDFACFDAAHPQELILRHAETVLSSETVRNPLVLLANYFFDSIPQDCFTLQNGQLQENLVTLSALGPAADLNDPALLGQLKISYDHSPIHADYYDDPHFNQVLHNYQQRFPDITFTFPCAALHCLRFFSELSNGRLLLLSGDKGHRQAKDLLGRNPAYIAIHGSISMMVNYHAIGEYVCNRGGRFLHSTHLDSSLHVCAYLLGQHPSDYLETALSFHETIEHWAPNDFYKMRFGIAKMCNSLSVEELISYIRLCHWDSFVFLECCSTLLDRVQEAPKDEKRELYRVVQHVWDTYYHIGEEEDLAFSLGMLLHRMDYYREALGYYQYSLELYGPDDGTFYNMALCHSALQQTETALTCIDRVLELDPSSQLARRIHIELQSQLTR